MRRRFAFALIALVLALPAVSFVAAEAGPSFSELEESLTCQCGCGLTVHSCNHLQCPSAIPLRAEIREQMALDKDKDEILGHFRDKYGEKILSSPTTRGFNLLAWTLPFVAVALGGLLIVFVVRRWVRQREARDAGAAPAPVRSASTDAAYKDVFERELRDLDN
jgi:cytochrome c-type biogenesis protein CcmH